MNLFEIAWRNLRYRSLASFLTTMSMALGVGLTVLVMSISGIINQSLQRNSNVGYNLIVGSKGSSTQLVFNSVYYLSKPIENLKYSYYLEFLPGNQRQEAYAKLGGALKDPDRSGLYAMFARSGFAIPICLGDYVGRFRAVATTPDFFNLLRHGERNDLEYEFASGKNFIEESPENGFFEAVLGAEVSREMQLGVGDRIQASHGSTGNFVHEQSFKVVGVLKATGTPNDRAAFINMEGFYLLEDHAAPERDEASGLEIRKKSGEKEEPIATAGMSRLAIEKREVTAILLRSEFAMNIEKQINKTPHAQAVSPIAEIGGLLRMYIEPVQWALLVLTLLVCVVSAVSILVSIYNSMNERTRDIAVMRALGASRDKVLAVILCEACLIATVGGAIGWIGGHALAAFSSPMVEGRTGVKISFLSIQYPNEFWIIPSLILIGILAGLIPALVAYRTDVSKSL
ncbi:MAG: FtsX-like permease family protein [Pirellulaceae bacterium]|nr:FtsX-like permease family protein [Pirellulaceae bacterium]